MQPPNRNLPDPYAHHHHTITQYYSHFPTQNPNPYPLHQLQHQHQHQHLQIESQFGSNAINPDPPGADPYLPSYSINHAGGVTYAPAIGAAPPPSAYAVDHLAQNWAAEQNVQQYGSTLYASGAMLPQDGTQPVLSALPTRTTWTNQTAQSRGHWKKAPKKTKIAQSAWCEVCKVECNTKDVLHQHKLGKKHLKNLEKLTAGSSVAPTPTPRLALQGPNNPVIGPLENPKAVSGQKKKKVETPQDLELKRRKVLEGGAAANAVRTCTICNVVCNSDTVFRFHLAGQKHLSMVKKSQQAAGGMAVAI